MSTKSDTRVFTVEVLPYDQLRQQHAKACEDLLLAIKEDRFKKMENNIAPQIMHTVVVMMAFSFVRTCKSVVFFEIFNLKENLIKM